MNRGGPEQAAQAYKENQQRPAKIRLEIGAAGLSWAPYTMRKNPDLFQGYFHIATDPGYSNKYQGYTETSPKDLANLNALFRQTETSGMAMPARGQRLPFRDGTIDEVTMSNVLGAPFENLSPRQVWDIILDVKRVLNDKGLFVIYESRNPDEPLPREFLPGFLDTFGLRLDKMIPGIFKEDFAQAVRLHALPENAITQRDYIALIKKKEPGDPDVVINPEAMLEDSYERLGYFPAWKNLIDQIAPRRKRR